MVKRIVMIIFLISTLLIAGCSMNVEEASNSSNVEGANEIPSIDEDAVTSVAFEEYKQQTEKIINDLNEGLKQQAGKINVLTTRVEKLESEIWKFDGDYVEYYNEEYDFGFYLPRELMENAVIETEEYTEGSNVVFSYSGYKHESGLMQNFFSVYITSQEQEVRGCGEEVCTPYMIQNDQAYYITIPIDIILPPEESDYYSELSINEYELIARSIKK